jgi:hypothetical protein
VKCPRCGLDNSETSLRCSCGQDVEGLSEATEDKRFSMFGTTFQGAQIIESPASDNAKQHIARSFRAALAVPLIVLVLLFISEADIAGSLILMAVSAYIGWASYWGIVGVFKFIEGRRTAVKIGYFFEAHSFVREIAERLLTEKVGLGGMIAIPIGMGIVYGVLGGCVYEFMRCRRIAQNPALDPLEAE